MTSRPTRFKRPALLIVGCGDIGMRVGRLLAGRWRVLGLTTSADRAAELRAAGIVPVIGDLDRPASIARLAGLADAVLHLAPPPGSGTVDTRTANLLRVLGRRAGRLRRIVYASTSGVYGDCGGAWVAETRAVAPGTDRARRRVDAERRLRAYGRVSGVAVTLLRIPGIYGGGRGEPAGTRGLRGVPVLAHADDVYTNHIHADDLARICVAALHRGLPQRAVNAGDDSAIAMGDYFDLAADLMELPRPRRVARAAMTAEVSAMQMSFLAESRRLDNGRLKRELRVVPLYLTVAEGLAVEARKRPAPDRGKDIMDTAFPCARPLERIVR